MFTFISDTIDCAALSQIDVCEGTPSKDYFESQSKDYRWEQVYEPVLNQYRKSKTWVSLSGYR